MRVDPSASRQSSTVKTVTRYSSPEQVTSELWVFFPYGITQRYLPPDISELTHPTVTPARQGVLD